MTHTRIQLNQAYDLNSCYTDSRGNRVKTNRFGTGALCVPELHYALRRLDELVRDCGGTLYITDLFRPWSVQLKARQDFERGRKPFVAKPGSSLHGCGRAVDVDINSLCFSGQPREDWVPILWKACEHVGLSPIIDKPDIDASEAWHYELWGDWLPLKSKMDYSELVKAMHLDVGTWQGYSPNRTHIAYVQAQLHRVGYHDVGIIDGIYGNKTDEALKQFGLKLDTADLELNRLPTWKPIEIIEEKQADKKKRKNKRSV